MYALGYIKLYIYTFQYQSQNVATGQMPNVPPISRSTLKVPEVPELELDCGGEGEVVRGCVSSGTWPEFISRFFDPIYLGPKKHTHNIYISLSLHISLSVCIFVHIRYYIYMQYIPKNLMYIHSDNSRNVVIFVSWLLACESSGSKISSADSSYSISIDGSRERALDPAESWGIQF
jgi:hypothetical protein